MKHMSYVDVLHRVMNPLEYEIEMEKRKDEERLEHYRVLRELQKEAELSRHIPDSLDVETFNRAECGFIRDYFFGDTKSYNEWRKENEKYFD